MQNFFEDEEDEETNGPRFNIRNFIRSELSSQLSENENQADNESNDEDQMSRRINKNFVLSQTDSEENRTNTKQRFTALNDENSSEDEDGATGAANTNQRVSNFIHSMYNQSDYQENYPVSTSGLVVL